jgi:hypothetical protein
MAAGDLTSLANVKAWLFGTDPAGFAATQKPITAISQAANALVTCPGHGFAQGQPVMLSAIGGMVALEGETVNVTLNDANSFSIGVNSSAYPAYTGGGVASAEDVLLARLVTAESRFIGSWCGRSFALASYSETYNGAGGFKLALRNLPIVAVASLAIDGLAIPAGVPGTRAGHGWYNDDKLLYLIGYEFRRGSQNLQVAYSAGYAATPPELEQAAIELVGYRYRERSRIGEVSRSLGGQATAAFSQKDMPAAVATILAKYQRVMTG